MFVSSPTCKRGWGTHSHIFKMGMAIAYFHPEPLTLPMSKAGGIPAPYFKIKPSVIFHQITLPSGDIEKTPLMID